MHVMRGRGLNSSDTRLLKTMTKRVYAALNHQRKRGLLYRIEPENGRKLWGIEPLHLVDFRKRK